MSFAAVVSDVGPRVKLDDQALRSLSTFARRLDADERLGDLARGLLARLLDEPPREAVAAVREAGLEERLGREDARAFYLVLALAEVPSAEARHRSLGLHDELTRATFGDLGVWARHFQRQVGRAGISLEILDWSQRYLRGDLYRIGAFQLDLRPFEGDLRVHRAAGASALVARTLDGRAIDLGTGTVLGPAAAPEGPVVLEPGLPVFDLHVPADSMLSLRALAASVREARALFSRLRPDAAPVAIAGEAWILDPQVCAFLPRNVGLRALQAACHLYPSKLPEDKTVRRLFGPDATRQSVRTLPREGMNRLQRAVADFLAEPTNALRARGGFLLADAMDAMLAALGE